MSEPVKENLRTHKQYKKMFDEANVLLFPIRVGGVSFFGSVEKERVRTILEDWDAKDFGKIECGWEHNDPKRKVLVHYDGWGLV